MNGTTDASQNSVAGLCMSVGCTHPRRGVTVCGSTSFIVALTWPLPW